jgi:soluble lytic murein transglycosylase-like protein
VSALQGVCRAEATSAHDGEASQAEAQKPSTADLPPTGQTPIVSTVAKTEADYRALAAAEAARAGLPPEIADSVMAVESGYNAAAIGGAGEIGLMQILPSTARMLGFVGTETDLAVPQVNIHYGVTYLAQAWRLAAGDICTAVMKYRAGHGETRFSYLSVNYCVAVRGKLMARGYHVTGIVPVATFGEAGGKGGGGGSGCKRRCLGNSLGRVDFAALNTRLNAIVMQVRPRP